MSKKSNKDYSIRGIEFSSELTLYCFNDRKISFDEMVNLENHIFDGATKRKWKLFKKYSFSSLGDCFITLN